MRMLDFEKPLFEIKSKIESLKESQEKNDVDLQEEIDMLEASLDRETQKVYTNLKPWDRVQLARLQERPTSLDYIPYIFDSFIELHGFFSDGLNGFMMSFQMATFSFVGIELIGVTAGETKDPKTIIPKAINSVPLRILVFYVGALAVIMSIIPWTQINPDDSPFVKLFALIGIPFAAGIINFVVLTAAASSCNSGIFSNSRMLFGLSKKEQAPPIFESTNKNGVPHIGIIVSSALLFIAAFLNYVIPNSTLVFTYVTTLSTVLFIIVWMLITLAYIKYHHDNPESHKKAKYKLPGGKYMGYIILVFFLVIFALLFVNQETRIGIYITPIWFIILILMYLRYKKVTKQN